VSRDLGRGRRARQSSDIERLRGVETTAGVVVMAWAAVKAAQTAEHRALAERTLAARLDQLAMTFGVNAEIRSTTEP
jgi:hypothetical protein